MLFWLFNKRLKLENIDLEEIKSLAALPSLDEIHANLVAMISTPASRIASVVSAPGARVARVLNAYAVKDQVA